MHDVAVARARARQCSIDAEGRQPFAHVVECIGVGEVVDRDRPRCVAAQHLERAVVVAFDPNALGRRPVDHVRVGDRLRLACTLHSRAESPAERGDAGSGHRRDLPAGPRPRSVGRHEVGAGSHDHALAVEEFRSVAAQFVEEDLDLTIRVVLGKRREVDRE